MSTPRRRDHTRSPLHRCVTSAALLVLVPLIAACGFNAQTDQVYQAATGVNKRDGQVDVLNALIVSDANGSGTFAGTLVNKSATQTDQLISISDAASGGSVDLPPGSAVNLGASGAVRLANADIVPGAFVRLKLQFASGQTTTVNAPVVTHDGDYAEVPVGPVATAPASPATS